MAFPESRIENVSRAQAVAGTSQPTNHAILGARLAGVAKSCRLSAADGWRGQGNPPADTAYIGVTDSSR